MAAMLTSVVAVTYQAGDAGSVRHRDGAMTEIGRLASAGMVRKVRSITAAT